MVIKRNALLVVITLALVAGIAIAVGLRITDESDSKVVDRDSQLPSQARVAVPAPAPTPGPAPVKVSPQEPTTDPAVGPGTDSAGVHIAPQVATNDPIVEPDPNFEAELRNAFISTVGWETDFSRHSVPYSEIFSGGVPRDGIPPLDRPKFTTTELAGRWLGDEEPVIAFEINGDARAYPLQVLTWHEIVNEVVGGLPVTVTFCPLCNSAIVFDRRLDGVVYDFGVSGNLRNSDLIMWDRQTESWWQQLTGEAIVGELAGKRLNLLPGSIISYADFQSAHPEGSVLSRDTGFKRPYGQNPYAGYDRADNPPFLFDGDLDGRLLPKERVVAVTIDDVGAAFPFTVLQKERAVNYALNGKDLVVFFKPGTRSALDKRSIEGSRDVGATGVFDVHVDGRALTFRADGDKLVDNETGSVWNILGQAVEGPLSGTELAPILHGDHFWFAWGAFNPDTLIYQGKG